MFTVNDIIDFAIRLEKNGETVYRSALQHIDNTAIRSALEWAAEEESQHAEWFSELKSKAESDENDQLLREMNESLIDEFVSEQSFSLKEVDFLKINTVRDMLDIFVEFENDTILFYDMLRAFIVDEDTLRTLDKIIAEEKEHVKKFSALSRMHNILGFNT